MNTGALACNTYVCIENGLDPMNNSSNNNNNNNNNLMTIIMLTTTIIMMMRIIIIAGIVKGLKPGVIA